MSKKIFSEDSVKISRRAYNKIVMWSMALTEVGFVLAGRNGKITNAYRLRNISSEPRDWIVFSSKEKQIIIQKIKSHGMEVIGLGHSHPHKTHLLYPSKSDVCYFPKDEIHLLSLPSINEIRAFILKKSVKSSHLPRVSIVIF